MRAVMMMFDSLNRAMLEPYGYDWTKTPNFTRLAEHAVRFDNCYASSLPCMPARRELHTLVPELIDPSYVEMIQYFIGLSGRTE